MKRKGWSDEENALLTELAQGAKANGSSLSGAFRLLAQMTGRQPDSVRNRYYALLKEKGMSAESFVPFSPEEADELMRAMNELTLSGRSVRSAAFVLAKGDAKLMLRYQNKYRSMTKPARGSVCALPEKKDVPPDGYEERISRLTEALKEQHERFMALHAMFAELCSVNRELASRLAAAGETKGGGSPSLAGGE